MRRFARSLRLAKARVAVVAHRAQGLAGALLVAGGVGWQVGAGWGAVVLGGFLLLGAAVS